MLCKAVWDQNSQLILSDEAAGLTGAASLLALEAPPKWVLI